MTKANAFNCFNIWRNGCNNKVASREFSCHQSAIANHPYFLEICPDLLKWSVSLRISTELVKVTICKQAETYLILINVVFTDLLGFLKNTDKDVCLVYLTLLVSVPIAMTYMNLFGKREEKNYICLWTHQAFFSQYPRIVKVVVHLLPSKAQAFIFDAKKSFSIHHYLTHSTAARLLWSVHSKVSMSNRSPLLPSIVIIHSYSALFPQTPCHQYLFL